MIVNSCIIWSALFQFIVEQLSLMLERFMYACRHCVYWSVLLLSASILLLMLSLALTDVSTIADINSTLSQLKQTPSGELNCLEACMNWYSEDRGLDCCSLQTGLCTQKELCRTQNQKAQELNIDILKSDAYSESLVGAVALIIVIFVPFYQYRHTTLNNFEGGPQNCRTPKQQGKKSQERDPNVQSILTRQSLSTPQSLTVPLMQEVEPKTSVSNNRLRGWRGPQIEFLRI